MGSNTWPSSPLDAAQRAFDLLTCLPAPLGHDARGVEGLPQRMLPLDELRDLLLKPEATTVVRDRVWSDLVTRARRDGPEWVVATVGMALPGLRKQAGLLASGWKGDSEDLDAELIVGFLERLRTVDLVERRICGRLIDAGVRCARKVRDRYADTHMVHVDSDGPRTPKLPWDHPDWVLARAVAAGVLDPDEANLIAATRLGHETLAQAAEALGMDTTLAGKWRRLGELRLRGAIAAGDLEYVPLRVRRPWRRRRVLGGPAGGRVGFLLGGQDRKVGRLGTQQGPLVGKTSVRGRVGVGAPGIVAAPAV
ncbi:MAG TPA: hypothetical protein VFC19_32670 [Candidatus Limnocylindrales bacterium]|nr:hypothetical protein [Candidatus Limnocylindrales bacterium]